MIYMMSSEQGGLRLGQVNPIPPRGRLSGGCGSAYGVRGFGLRTQPYSQGWHGAYNPHGGLTLADAVRGTWTAAGNTGGIGGWDVPAPVQNHVTEAPLMTTSRLGYSLQPARNEPVCTTYSYPTIYNGKLAQAMSSIARNPDTGIPGRVTADHLDDNFNTEVSKARAIKLDLKTRQQAHKIMLQKLIRSGGSCSSLKKTLQARAAVYSELTDRLVCA